MVKFQFLEYAAVQMLGKTLHDSGIENGREADYEGWGADVETVSVSIEDHYSG
jgi:hypothetical protein